MRKAFEAFGQAISTSVVKDQQIYRSKGFGFVEMPAKAEARSAINDLNGKELKGQTLNVNEARPRTESRGARSGYGGGRGGGRQGGGRRSW